MEMESPTLEGFFTFTNHLTSSNSLINNTKRKRDLVIGDCELHSSNRNQRLDVSSLPDLYQTDVQSLSFYSVERLRCRVKREIYRYLQILNFILQLNPRIIYVSEHDSESVRRYHKVDVLLGSSINSTGTLSP